MPKSVRSTRLSDETWEQLEVLKARFNVDSRTKVIELLVQSAWNVPVFLAMQFGPKKVYSSGDVIVITKNGIELEKVAILEETQIENAEPIPDNEIWRMVQEIKDDDFYRPYFHKGTEFTDPISGDTWTKSNE